MKNIFCESKNLKNESDVESLFVDRLLSDLNFPDEKIMRKTSIEELTISYGSKKQNFKPDYVLYGKKYPKIVIDAKSPKENIYDYHYQISGYALKLNQRYDENHVKYAILTNGFCFALYLWDNEKPILELTFEDFNNKNDKYNKLKNILSYENINDSNTMDFFIEKPSIEEITNIFQDCHNLIWSKENLLPADAFYEFTKLIFLKLNEDKKIHEKYLSTGKIEKNDFYFTTDWIDNGSHESPHPINNILFKNLLTELDEQISKNEKKRIFEQNEEINLKPSTIRAVVEKLEYKNLYAIDEDINGRMFEVFLSAVVRGKELGAYFTPRNIVDCMVKIADLQVKKKDGEIHIDKILDGCCGSGGFLINAMSNMILKLEKNPFLQPYYEDIKKRIQTESIYGIEKNPSTSRIARINMYVHGDGGSKIYCADALDKTVKIEKGERKIVVDELKELRNELQDKQTKFDVILTNPPFAMSYNKKEEHEKFILDQYSSTNKLKNISYKKNKNELKTSVKSNILFLGRYLDLLVDGGKLIIVLDNSVFNTVSHKEYRDWIKNNFIIKAIISLPKYAFIQSGAGCVTSILYLEKRKNSNQIQPPIFARTVYNTGLDKNGKEIKENDLPDVVKEFKKFEETGKLFLKGKEEINYYENDLLFLISPDKLDERMDVSFHTPSYNNLIQKLYTLKNKGVIELKKVDDYKCLESIKIKEENNNWFKYVDIGVIDKERGKINLNECEEGTLDDLPARARLKVNENDVIFPLSYDSLGKVAIIPKELNNELVSTGFYGIKLNDYKSACLLWDVITSNIVQKQFIHISSGYTQREISKQYLKKYLLLPIPINSEKIIDSTIKNLKKAEEYREKEIKTYEDIKTSFESIFL